MKDLIKGLMIARARRRLIKLVRAANEGKIDKNLPHCGHTGEVRGSSKTDNY